MYSAIKRILLFTAIIPFLMLQNASAHDASYGYSTWTIQEREITASISIDTLSIIELGEVDQNQDGTLTEEELRAGSSTIMPYLEERLEVSVNEGESLKPELESMAIPDFTVAQIHLTFKSSEQIDGVKIHYQLFFDKSNNNHTNIATIYTTGEKPVEHVFKASEPVWSGDISSAGSFVSTVIQFIILGVEHILVGYDHILFLIALIVIGLKFREVIKVVTAFTIAHSITLILAALEIISLNSRFVESVIALSICYVAAENIIRKEVNYRWVVAFAFGLIHGFGFAGVLQEIGIPSSNFVAALLAFNVGVEIGQILLFLLIMPILYAIHKVVSVEKTKIAISAIVFIFGLLWFAERALNLAIMPL